MTHAGKQAQDIHSVLRCTGVERASHMEDRSQCHSHGEAQQYRAILHQEGAPHSPKMCVSTECTSAVVLVQLWCSVTYSFGVVPHQLHLKVHMGCVDHSPEHIQCTEAPNTIVQHKKVSGALKACHRNKLCLFHANVDYAASDASSIIRRFLSKWREVARERKPQEVLRRQAFYLSSFKILIQ